MTTLKYIKEKRIRKQIKKAQNRKAVLKQQIKVIDGRPTERPVFRHRVWRDMLGSTLVGGVAGAVIAAANDANVGIQILAGIGGAQAGSCAAFLGHFVYTCKPFSNAFNKYSKKIKENQIKRQDRKIAKAMEDFHELEM